jgi:predicted nucleic-acid-binding Zn-ribbon protein
MIAPQPFTIKCSKCHWSKCIEPKSDVVDMRWGVVYSRCPKCGEQTQREEGCCPSEAFLNKLKNLFS